MNFIARPLERVLVDNATLRNDTMPPCGTIMPAPGTISWRLKRDDLIQSNERRAQGIMRAKTAMRTACGRDLALSFLRAALRRLFTRPVLTPSRPAISCSLSPSE